MSLPNGTTQSPKDASPASTLTPQRKHRKLLKDGSGSEVWPESLERVFVQGLRQYWESPWATYSRGRSRWRNQFLVDYLQKAGIVRTKKQVASHIQVLRNMWKGEPEYHLVAGGEELFTESGLLAPPVKLEDQLDSGALIPLDFDDSETISSTSSPNFSPPENTSDFPPSPGQPLNSALKPEYSPSHLAFPNLTTCDSPSSPVRDRGYTTLPSPHSGEIPLPFTAAVQQPKHLPNLDTNTPPSTSEAFPLFSAPGYLPGHTRYAPPNRVTSLCVFADGMTPLSVNIDALFPPPHLPVRSPPVIIKIRLSAPSVDDIRCPPTLHGFTANVCLAYVWASSAKCTTRVYNSGMCISEETDAIQVSNIDVGNVIAVVPESQLSRCRWLDPSISTNLTQDIIADNELLIHIIYELDRRSCLPSAEVLGYQRYRQVERTSSLPASPASYRSQSQYIYAPASASTAVTSFPYTQYIRSPNPTSLSCALTPVNNTLHSNTLAASMTF